MVQDTEQTRPITTGPGRPRRSRRGRGHRWSGVVRLTAALMLIGAGQSAVPAATAQSSPGCAIPAAQVAVAAPPAAAAATPETVIIAPVRRGVSTPVAEIGPVAAPIATPDPLAALSAELTDVANALAACLTGGDAELVATLATERYLGQLYGGDTPLPRDDYLALAAELDPIPTEIRAVTNVATEGDDRATAEITSVVGRQLLVSRWSFARAAETERDDDESRWQVDHEEPLPFEPPADAPTIAVAITDYTFSLEATTVSGPMVVLSGRNGGAQDHEMLVLRLDDGMTTRDLLRGAGPGLPDNIAYIGQATVPGADRVDLVLVDLEPGVYTVVCFFLTAEGIPHLALGMEATFTAEE